MVESFMKNTSVQIFQTKSESVNGPSNSFKGLPLPKRFSMIYSDVEEAPVEQISEEDSEVDHSGGGEDVVITVFFEFNIISFGVSPFF